MSQNAKSEKNSKFKINSEFLMGKYSDIRDILRVMYIFGCFNRDNFREYGIKDRKYDKEKRRIKSYLRNDFYKEKRQGRDLIPYCIYNMAEMHENPMAETYRNKSFTINEISSYFFVLTLLNSGKEMSLKELLESVPLMFESDTLLNHVKELISKDLVVSKKTGPNVTFKLSDDCLKDFGSDELIRLYWLLELMKNVVPLEMPFYFLQKKLKLYLNTVRNIEEKSESIHPFQNKCNHLFNVLDNEVVITILEAIHSKKELTIEYKSKEFKNIKGKVIPIKVVHECTYSTQYLLCYSSEMECIQTRRIDKIIDAKIGKTVEKSVIDKVETEAQKALEMHNISDVCDKLEKVKIEFYIDDEKEKFVLDRIKRERKTGRLEKIKDGVYVFTIEVGDSKELTPWIMSFGERAKVVGSNNGTLIDSIKHDLEETIKKYESIR